jgi:(1->4)-alpha-D-glucan 1-alpha-D-glucosylmutase
VWEARKGSRHGYDVTDPARIREELGGEEAFLTLARDLKERVRVPLRGVHDIMESPM